MLKQIKPLAITASTLVNATGCGTEATLSAIKNESSGLRDTPFPDLNLKTWIGKVDAVDSVELEASLKYFNCRNNQLAKLALDTDNFRNNVNDAIGRYGRQRIGVFMGTSTSGKAETEKAYLARDKNSGALPESFDILHTHNIGSLLDYVQHSLGLNGVGFTISTACSSSAKVFAAAYRHIEAGVCDAAVVGGVDSLCLTSFYGFNSLQLLSDEPCRPWDVNRNGISIGEAAGFMLLERSSESGLIKLKGYGESSDAYHMSTPHPEGKGAVMAMQAAIARAGMTAEMIDYINLHGTATPSNDAAETQALERIFSNEVKCSSTKGITGHTLGAAGITEAIICSLVLAHDVIPANVNLKNQDPGLAIKVLETNIYSKVDNVMSNSFGFGGSNCSLVFGW